MLLESFCLFIFLTTAITGRELLWFNKWLGTTDHTPANPQVEEKHRRCEKSPFFPAVRRRVVVPLTDEIPGGRL